MANGLSAQDRELLSTLSANCGWRINSCRQASGYAELIFTSLRENETGLGVCRFCIAAKNERRTMQIANAPNSVAARPIAFFLSYRVIADSLDTKRRTSAATRKSAAVNKHGMTRRCAKMTQHYEELTRKCARMTRSYAELTRNAAEAARNKKSPPLVSF